MVRGCGRQPQIGYDRFGIKPRPPDQDRKFSALQDIPPGSSGQALIQGQVHDLVRLSQADQVINPPAKIWASLSASSLLPEAVAPTMATSGPPGKLSPVSPDSG